MPTFGYTTAGASTNASGGNFESVSKETLSEPARLEKLTAYLDGVSAGAEHVRGVVYADSAGEPGALMGFTNEISIPDDDPAVWRDFVFASSLVLTPATYWLGMHWGSGITTFNYYYDTLASNARFVAQDFNNGPADPFGTPAGTLNQRISIYATYPRNVPQELRPRRAGMRRW